jgi:hypothetical protein
MEKHTPGRKCSEPRARSTGISSRSSSAHDGDRQVVGFPNRRKEDRERLLMWRAMTGLAELGAVVGELAILRGSIDGAAMFGQLACPSSNDLEALVHVRRRRS